MEIFAALIGFAGALLGALLTFVLGRLKASDRSAFVLWRTAFDRAAFKGPYQFHSKPHSFEEAIGMTIKCVSTGVLESRRGTLLGKAKPKGQIRRAEWRTLGDTIERNLTRIAQLIPPQSEKDLLTIDAEREEVIRALNAVWRTVGSRLSSG
jgi:hypothetical protein